MSGTNRLDRERTRNRNRTILRISLSVITVFLLVISPVERCTRRTHEYVVRGEIDRPYAKSRHGDGALKER